METDPEEHTRAEPNQLVARQSARFSCPGRVHRDRADCWMSFAIHLRNAPHSRAFVRLDKRHGYAAVTLRVTAFSRVYTLTLYGPRTRTTSAPKGMVGDQATSFVSDVVASAW